MIHSYVAGDTVRFRQTGDVTNPTWFTGHPVTPEVAAKMAALLAHARQKERETIQQETPVAMINSAAKEKRRQSTQLASQLTMIENVHYKGEVHKEVTDAGMINNIVTGLPNRQFEDLLEILTNDIAMQAQSFREETDAPIDEGDNDLAALEGRTDEGGT